MSLIKTFTVTVVSTGSGNKYFIDGVQQDTVNLAEGYTYKFDQADSSNNNHPLRFSTTSDGTHNSGSEYTTGVTTSGTPGNAGAYTQIAVAASAPQLYYYCTNHSGMGGQANTEPSDTWGLLQWGQNSWSDQNSVQFSLTGLSATSSLGELAYAAADDGWGRDAWGDNAWGENQTTVPLTGLSATSSLGELAYAAADDGWGRDAWGDNSWGNNQTPVTLTGLTATTSLPSVGWGNQVFGSDNEGWGGIYQLPVADVMGLTGLSIDADVGTPTTTQLSVITLTGLTATTTLGVVQTDDVSIGLIGLSAQSAVGSITPADVMGLTGLSAQTTVGSLTITSNPVTILTGVSATSSVGGISIGNETEISLTGVSSTSAIGSLTTTQLTIANLDNLGLTATSSLNTNGLILKYYKRLSPKTSTGYSRKTPKDSTGYTRKVAN